MRHSPRSEREQLCQDSTVIRERSKTNVRSKLHPDGAVIKERSWPLDRLCSHHSERVRMKTCLTRERGTGGRSEGEDEHRWTFVNDEKHINNALESNRSRLLSGVVEKSCSPTKEISKTWMAYPMPSTENNTGYLPMSKHQTRSKARYDPSHCPQTAAPSTLLRPFKQPHSHHSERVKPCQEGMIIRECSKMNVRLKLHPDGAVIQASSRPLDVRKQAQSPSK